MHLKRISNLRPTVALAFGHAAGWLPMISRISLYVVAAALIAANFLRVGNMVAVALCLATPLLFLVRRRWSLLILQWLAYVAAAIWLATAWQIVDMRLAFASILVLTIPRFCV